MKAKRRRHDAKFKSIVALEALKGIKTIQQIAHDNDVHPAQVTAWNKTVSERLSDVFEPGSSGGSKDDFERVYSDN